MSAWLMQMATIGVDSIHETSLPSGRAFMPVGMQPIPRSNEDEEGNGHGANEAGEI